MPKVDDERVAEDIAKDNASELIVKQYSMKLRVRTVVLFIALLCVIFIILGFYVSFGWMSIFNSYESDVSLANSRSILNNLADEIDNLRKFVQDTGMWEECAQYVEDYANGNTENFPEFWREAFYSLDEWAIENLVALYDSDFNLIKGEHYETSPVDMATYPADIPPILASDTEASKNFLRNLYYDNETKFDIVRSANKHPVLIYMGPVKYESNDTVVGYIIIGTDFGAVIRELIHDDTVCLLMWDDPERFPKIVSDSLTMVISQQVLGMGGYRRQRAKTSSLVNNDAAFRACENNYEGFGQHAMSGYVKVSGKYDTDAQLVFRVDNDRTLENMNKNMSLIILLVMFLILVIVYIILHAYLELVILKRLRKLRDLISRLSLIDEAMHPDSVFGEVEAAEAAAAGQEGAKKTLRTGAEIGGLMFLAKKRIELLTRRYKRTVAELQREENISFNLELATERLVLAKGRPEASMPAELQFGNSPPGDTFHGRKLTLMSVFKNPHAFELFKDYCERDMADSNAARYLFFVLDVCWLRNLAAIKHKHYGSKPKVVVGTARIIGQSYISQHGAMNIKLSKAVKRKLLSYKSYAEGMYDDAFHEAITFLNTAFENFKKTKAFLEMKSILAIMYPESDENNLAKDHGDDDEESSSSSSSSSGTSSSAGSTTATSSSGGDDDETSSSTADSSADSSSDDDEEDDEDDERRKRSKSPSKSQSHQPKRWKK